jgi:membrane-bound lytic murein transglycosylase MltF
MKQKLAFLLSGAVVSTVVLGGLLSLVLMKDGNDEAAVTLTLDPQTASNDTLESGQAATEAEPPNQSSPDAAQATTAKSEIIDHVLEAWTGDLDGMVERGFVRLLTAYNPIYLSYDGIGQKGLAVDLSHAFEEHLSELTGTKAGALQVIIMPVSRDDLLPYLLDGKGDIAAANLTITPARQAQVEFSDPTYPDVRELVITGPAAPDVAGLDDLVSTEVHIRRSSSYFEHLTALNQIRKTAGQEEIPIVETDEVLEDYDLLELVNAGLIPAVIVDSHKAALWAQVFENIKVHQDLAIHEGGSIAWAVRKDTPKLLGAINGFVKVAKKGTLLGNILIKRYLASTDWIDDVRSGEAQKRYEAAIGIIKKYAGQYEFDWLMIVAQGYQESKLDQSTRSKAGAIGIMQVLPTTAADPNVGIHNIEQADPNVHAGVKYLRFLRNRYFDSADIEPLDQVLLSFAAYNAGPANISKAQQKALRMGLDPNRWFGQLEIAAAKTISREPVLYVRNIYKYYVAYKKIAALRERRQSAEAQQK